MVINIILSGKSNELKEEHSGISALWIIRIFGELTVLFTFPLHTL